MKHKIISLFSVLVLVFLIAFACNEDNLNLAPLQPTEALFFQNEDEMEAAVRGMYAKLTDIYWYNAGGYNHKFWLLPGDDLTALGNNPFEVFFNLNASVGEVNYIYKKHYELINRANIILAKVAEVDPKIYKDANLQKYHRGEALFLRGWSFFQLWNYYGTSPLQLQRIELIENAQAGPSKDTELLDQAIKDFTEAASLLPAAWNTNNRGRITANAANGFLGKALVFRASFKKNNADFTAAIAAFNKITGRSLVANFEDNFNANTENNDESLFEFQATQNGTDNVWLPNDFGNAVGSTSAYWGYFENHWSTFGAPTYKATKKLIAAFDPADPRLPLSADSSRAITKYVLNDKKNNTGPGSANNPRILRLADVLLLKAEALLESGGSTSEAIGLVNQIRTRARKMVPNGTIPADYSTTETDKNKIWSWIANERFIELAAEEGHRWLDLRRWHYAGRINLSNWDFSSDQPDLKFEAPKNLLYPIPLNELDFNKNMQQNQGY